MWRSGSRDAWPQLPRWGRYHNHRFSAEPSRDDMRQVRKQPSLGHYLCGPSGLVRRLSAKEGTVNVR